MSAALLLALSSHDDASRDTSRSSRREQRDHHPIEAQRESSLVTQIRAGNTAAFDALFDELWPSLVRFARAQLGHHEGAEDVVQDVFARVWERHSIWEPGPSVRGYFFRAVRNAVLNVRKHERIVDTYARDPSGVPSPPRTDDVLESNDLLTRLNEALARLSDDQRLAVTLRYEHALKYADIAVTLGISAAAAEKRVLRGLESLRAWMRLDL